MKTFSLITFFFLNILQASAQNDESISRHFVSTVNKQKTANSKDMLTTLYRIGINNLLGKSHSFKFSSTFLGIDSILHRNSNRSNYSAFTRFLRENSLNITITGDSNNNINKYSGGFSFTFLNKKDMKFHKLRKDYLSDLTNLTIKNADLRKELIMIIPEPTGTPDEAFLVKQKYQIELNTAFKDKDFSNLSPVIIKAFKSDELLDNLLLKNVFRNRAEARAYILTTLEGKNQLSELFKNIAAAYARKPLWTFSPTVVYDKGNKQPTWEFATEFTVGLGKNLDKKPWELEMKSGFKIENDTSIKSTNYQNKPISFSLGVNKVLLENEEKESKMELKFFTQYDRQLGKVPVNTEEAIFTLNTTFRVNIYKTLWLPVTLKYDTQNSNLLGLFSITANLGD